VLLVTGPVGVGKSSVAAAAAHLLRQAGDPGWFLQAVLEVAQEALRLAGWVDASMEA
jgi:anion-transporting  ArsA/GET3 family ATPase